MPSIEYFNLAQNEQSDESHARRHIIFRRLEQTRQDVSNYCRADYCTRDSESCEHNEHQYCERQPRPPLILFRWGGARRKTQLALCVGPKPCAQLPIGEAAQGYRFGAVSVCTGAISLVRLVRCTWRRESEVQESICSTDDMRGCVENEGPVQRETEDICTHMSATPVVCICILKRV